jgi:integrase
MSLADIRMEQVQQFVTKSSKSAKTTKNVITTLMSMWSTAQAWGYVQHNPFPRGASGRLLLALPAAAPGETYHFTVEEALAIIDKAQGRWKTFFRLLAETGMRPGELAGLRRDAIGDGVLKITQSVWGQKVQTVKSKAGVRTLAISASLRQEIQEMINGEREHLRSTSRANTEGSSLEPAPEKGAENMRLNRRGLQEPTVRCGEDRNGQRASDDLLFTTKKGRPLSMDNFRQRVLDPILVELGIDKKLERLGILRCGNYAFRHMNATLMDQLNTPMKTRQSRLGHEPGSPVTLGNYTHAIDADDRMAADRIGALLASKQEMEAVQ